MPQLRSLEQAKPQRRLKHTGTTELPDVDAFLFTELTAGNAHP